MPPRQMDRLKRLARTNYESHVDDALHSGCLRLLFKDQKSVPTETIDKKQRQALRFPASLDNEMSQDTYFMFATTKMETTIQHDKMHVITYGLYNENWPSS